MMSPILQVKNLTTVMPTRRGLLTIVDDVSFDLKAGECFGIVGESGSGKSMTCRSILGLVPNPGRISKGNVIYNQQDLCAMNQNALNKIRGKEIAMVVQNSIAALNPVLRIGHQISEAMLEHGLVDTRAEAVERATELMRAAGIPAPEERLNDYPHQLSGGMCQRVVIAIALACSPRIILADEPTSALDVTIQDQILKLLQKLQNDLQLGIVLVTHDMGVVAHSCQKVGVMYAGQLVEISDVSSLFRSPRHPYTVGLLNCVPQADSHGRMRGLQPIPGIPPDLADLPSGCRFHPRCPIAGPECKTGDFPLRQVDRNHFSRCIKHEEISGTEIDWTDKSILKSGLKDETMPDYSGSLPTDHGLNQTGAAPFLEVRGLTKQFLGVNTIFHRITGKTPARVVAVDNVSFQIQAGEIFSLVGESGSGKTTLGQAILRLVEPNAGQVLYQGKDVLTYSKSEMLAARRDLQMIFQDPYSSLNPRLTIRQLLSEVIKVHKIPTSAGMEARVLELVSLVGLPQDALDRYPRHFSGGQRQRIGIARALAVNPSFIVADEPVSSVDVSVQAQIMNLLLDLRDQLGLTLLFIAHDLSVVRYISTRVGVMYLGRIIEIAPKDDLFASARHPYTQGLLNAVPSLDPDQKSSHVAIQGEPPSPLNPPAGCHFHPRCRLATDHCRSVSPVLEDIGGGHLVSCHHHVEAFQSH